MRGIVGQEAKKRGLVFYLFSNPVQGSICNELGYVAFVLTNLSISIQFWIEIIPFHSPEESGKLLGPLAIRRFGIECSTVPFAKTACLVPIFLKQLGD